MPMYILAPSSEKTRVAGEREDQASQNLEHTHMDTNRQTQTHSGVYRVAPATKN